LCSCFHSMDFLHPNDFIFSKVYHSGHLLPDCCAYDRQTQKLLVTQSRKAQHEGKIKYKIIVLSMGEKHKIKHIVHDGQVHSITSPEISVDSGFVYVLGDHCMLKFRTNEVINSKQVNGEFIQLDHNFNSFFVRDNMVYGISDDNWVRNFGIDGILNRNLFLLTDNEPHGIAVDSHGNIFVGHGSHISVFNHQTLAFDHSIGHFHDKKLNLTIGPQDHLIVCDSVNRRIFIFDTNQALICAFGSHGNGEHDFERPTGIFLDKAHFQLFVCDQGNRRIQSITFPPQPQTQPQPQQEQHQDQLQHQDQPQPQEQPQHQHQLQHQELQHQDQPHPQEQPQHQHQQILFPPQPDFD